jgi:dynein heavy chain
MNPKAVTINELFGFNDIYTNTFTHGIVSKLVTQAMEDGIDARKWIVFDGPVDAEWIENLNTVLDDNKMLCLPDGKRIKLPNNFSMMFEVENLNVASPATVSRCGMVYFDRFTVDPLDAFSKFRKDLRGRLATKAESDPRITIFAGQFDDQTFSDALNELLQSAMAAFKNNSDQLISNVEYSIINCGLRLFELELEKLVEGVLRKARDLKGQAALEKFYKGLDLREMLFVLFGFSLAWSVGGNLTETAKSEFSAAFKPVLAKRTSTMLNPYASVFDFYFNYDKLAPASWKSAVEEFAYVSGSSFSTLVVETAETTTLKYFLESLCLHGVQVLINGPTGVGKTSVIKSFLGRLPENFVASISSFSAQSLSKNLENALGEKLVHRGKDLAPSAGKMLLFFIDDINMPKLDTYGSQPVNELVRQIIDQGGFYDLKKYVFRPVKNTVFIAACAPPEGGRNPMSQRLVRHFHTLCLAEVSEDSYERIFTSILNGFLKSAGEKESLLAPGAAIVKNTIKIYKSILTSLLPTPAKCHYTFNMRDVSKVFQGILQCDAGELDSEDRLNALWLHELTRVFGDRLIDAPERNWFAEKLIAHSLGLAKYSTEKLEALNFSSVVNPKYRQVVKPEELTAAIQESLKSYAIMNGKDLGLVVFPDMVKHICRIKRILSFARGHALLLGISGCGKRALANLAVFVNKNHVYRIEVTRNYKFQSWRDDLKAMMKLAAEEANLDGKKGVTFIMSEDQFVNDAFLEDVNNLLNIGEIPNLFARDEIEELIGAAQAQIKDKKLLSSMTKQDVWEHFLLNVRENFHLVLTFSPVGSNFRSKCRQFPSLVNCCTIDYFSKWPVEALLTVAESELKRAALGVAEETIPKLARIATCFSETRRKDGRRVLLPDAPALLRDASQLHRPAEAVLQAAAGGPARPAPENKEVRGGPPETGRNQGGNRGAPGENPGVPTPAGPGQAGEQGAAEGPRGKERGGPGKGLGLRKEAAAISKTKTEVSEMRTQCQQELNEALPALNAARTAARSIDKSYIATIKTYNTVAKDIEMVLLALNLLFGKKESWDEVKKFLSDIELIKKLQDFEPTDVPLKTWTKLRQNYLSRPEFNPVTLKEKISEAISTLANYIINMEIYYYKKREVIPKEQKLQAAETQLAQVEEAMAVKFRELDDVKAVVDGLQAKLNSSLEREKNLEDEQKRAKLHLERAEKLLVGLAEESIRWKEFAISLRADEVNLIGDLLLSAACVCFSGPFNQKFREDLLKEWTAAVAKELIPVSDNLSLQQCLGNPVTIRDWQLKGLPADNFSVDNAVVVMNSTKFPLMIDPQMQMNKWLKNLYKDAGMMVIKNSNPQLLKLIENAVRFGNTVLIENVEETLDSSLEPVLLRQTIKKGPIYYLKLNDQEVPFNSDFRLFVTTKLQNPHYLPETTIKVNLVNCMVTEAGLEDQLLVEIVLNECPKLEEQRDSLIRQISDDKKQLLEIQARILRLINETQGNLLDDEELINTLDASKVTSEAVGTRMKDAEVTNANIDKAREVYQSLAVQGAMLYFIVAALGNLNFMYQFSLEYFVAYFTKKMRENEEFKQDAAQRVAVLEDKLTLAVFRDVSKGLYGCHKSFFAFILAVRTLQADGTITPKQWAFFATPVEAESKSEDEMSPFLKEKTWAVFQGLGVVSPAANLLKRSWTESRKILEELVKNSEVAPKNFQWLRQQFGASPFEALLILKTFREDKLEQVAQIFVEDVLGRDYLDFPTISLKDAVLSSSQDKPIIFILSPGADPLSSMLALAVEMDMEPRFKIASLGQGQGDKANEMIKTARLNGEWVLLQNCHLATSWLSQLEFLIENPSDEPHADFKLFLTTMPSSRFPSSILQRGIKLTSEPPKGVRANLRQIYSQLDSEGYDNTVLPVYKTLMFCLSMFHAIALERRKFGSIGWNIPYEWMNSDLETSQKHLRIYLEDSPEVPFDTLTTLVGLINYGGRITDYNDEKVVVSLLLKFFNPKALENDYSFASTDTFDYTVPATEKLKDVFEFIDCLPLVDRPEIFGLNANATINLDIKNAAEFKNYLSLFEPGGQGAGGESDSEEVVMKMVDKMSDRLCALIKIDQANPTQSMVIFRNQEALRFNELLKKMKSSLADLKDAIKGLVVMSLELEGMFASLLRGKVPENWEKLSYLSLKPVSSWFDDLLKRVEFFKGWMIFGALKSYWVSAFFFPQGFMTAVLQTFSREKGVAIDTLHLAANVTKETFESNDAVRHAPPEGVNIHGLFLENAHFDIKKGVLCEAIPKELLEQMPLVWLRPVVSADQSTDDKLFPCPVYKTSERRGELSTTGHSTNFITYFHLRFEAETRDFWVRRSVALLLQTND